MEPVDPCLDPRTLPAHSRAVVMGERQPEYTPLPSIRTPAGQIVTRWRLTSSEIEDLVRGKDLFLTILSHGSMNPVSLSVGPPQVMALERALTPDA